MTLLVCNPEGEHRLVKAGVSPLAQHACVDRHVLHDNFRMRRLAPAKGKKRPVPVVEVKASVQTKLARRLLGR